MSKFKWMDIAKNEYRVQTSWIRSNRRYFPLIAGGFSAVWVFYLAPMIVQSRLEDFSNVMVSQVAVVLFEIILFMLSAYLVIIPVSTSLRDEGGISRVELMLKAPVSPGDVLIGEFLGKIPIFAIFAFVVAGVFTAFLTPLGLSLLQITLIILMAFLTCLSSFWVGTLIASVLRTTIARTAKGKDLGKALSMLIVLPLVGLMWGMMKGDILTTLVDPNANEMVRMLLGLFPSSWAAEVIIAFARNPSNIGAVWVFTGTRVGGMVLFMVASLVIGWKIVDRVYSLEPTNLGVTVVGPDKTFYTVVKLLGGNGSFGSLLVSVFKDFGRRLENLSQIGYLVGLMLMMNFFIVKDAVGVQTMGLVMGTTMAISICSASTIRGKKNLFIYRKMPSGVKKFIKAKLLLVWLLVIPILAIVMVVGSFRFDVIYTGAYFMSIGESLLMAMAMVLIAMGLSLANPAYHQGSSAYFINFLMTPLLAAGCIFIPERVFHQEWLQVPFAFTVGLVMLYLGYRKLSTIE